MPLVSGSLAPMAVFFTSQGGEWCEGSVFGGYLDPQGEWHTSEEGGYTNAQGVFIAVTSGECGYYTSTGGWVRSNGGYWTTTSDGGQWTEGSLGGYFLPNGQWIDITVPGYHT